jgi:Protein of unknown function, DUF547
MLAYIGKYHILLLIKGILLSSFLASNMNVKEVLHPVTDYISLSQNLLYAARTGDSTETYQDTLAQVNESTLAAELTDDNTKKAFWLNIYNAYTQILLKQNPAAYQSRNHFFSSRQIPIAHHLISLDEIEHGILRHSKIKWSLGYFNKWFPSAFEKKFRVDKLDYRIHFALNCGARSCPPIAFYEPGNIDVQLNLAMHNYLLNEASYNPAKNVAELPAIMSWFRHDFGGKNKMIALLKEQKVVPKNMTPIIKFKKYNWTLYLDNYKN